MSRTDLVIEPRWMPIQDRRACLLPTALRPWLLDQGSLTRALTASCDGSFRVELVQQRRAWVLPTERRLLQMPKGLAAHVREVRLQCDAENWVFARTVLPLADRRGAARRLLQLRDRPLGAVLFADPSTRRLSMQVARMTARHALFGEACAHLLDPPKSLWGRRTLFDYRGSRLLVNELFLPVIPAR